MIRQFLSKFTMIALAFFVGCKKTQDRGCNKENDFSRSLFLSQNGKSEAAGFYACRTLILHI
jgi:hypothetical protein